MIADPVTIEQVKETATPALFARTASHGRWKMARHLAVIDAIVTRAIASGNGRLIITCPPRHGKSSLLSQYLPAWFVGTFPDRRVILASYEADFAASWGRKARQAIDEHGHLFGVSVDASSSAASRWDVAGHAGGMTTAGIRGPITGKGADVLIVDDPIKNDIDAASETIRERNWDWWQSTAYSRLEPGATAIIILTRWHEDDLAGRIIWRMEHGEGEQWTVVNMPAIAEPGDILERAEGEALWSDRYPIAELRRIRGEMSSYFWAALYQQRPAPAEGGIFKRGDFNLVHAVPERVAAKVRYWDLASSKDGDFTAGVKMMRTLDNRYILTDIRHGRWTSGEVDIQVKQAAQLDGYDTSIIFEQEPGASGVRTTDYFIRELAGWPVFRDRATGPKDVRWRRFAAQVEAGNVDVFVGNYDVDGFLNEMATVPNATHDDRADAATGAFQRLAVSRFEAPGFIPAGPVDTRRFGVQQDNTPALSLKGRGITNRYPGLKAE